jgi:hypothetical protein
MDPAIIVLIILAIAAVIAYAIYAAAQRRKALAAWAAKNGLAFSPDKIRDMDDRFPVFKCLRRGHSRYAHNMMAGELRGLTVTAFDYHYATGSGKNRRTHRFSAVIAGSPVPLKPLSIRREHAFDKVTEFFGWDDIDFESAEFSRKFYVKSSDRRWAFDVIHQGMMEYLLKAPKCSIQFDTTSLIVWKKHRFKTAEFDEAIGLIKGMLDRLPEYLFRE